MSTLHHDDKIDATTGDRKKPEMITFYNSTKAGVDVVDALCGSYNVSRNSKRWSMTIFYGLLNIAAVNANIIFRENQRRHMKRTEFIRNLGLSLVHEHLRLRKDLMVCDKFPIRTVPAGDPSPLIVRGALCPAVARIG